MSYQYTYQKEVASDRLTLEIQTSSITKALDHIDTYVDGDGVHWAYIYFKAELSAEEETTLTTIVNNHVPTPLDSTGYTDISPISDELHRPFVRADSRDDHDTTVFTARGDKWTSVVGEEVGTGDGSTKDFYLDHQDVRNVITKFDDVTQEDGYTVDYSTYEDNNLVTHFCVGKVTFDEAPSAGVVITADYVYATIAGADNLLTFDFSVDESPKTMVFEHCDPIHVKDGVVFYQNGETDSVMNLYIMCPNGTYYYDNNGSPKLATEDTVIMHYVVDQIMNGSAEMGIYIDVEGRSTAIPVSYYIKIVVDKGSANNLKGSVRMEINRQRTIII